MSIANYSLTASLRETNQEGKTALHLACAEGHIDVIKILIDRRAPVDVLDSSGLTPFEVLALPPGRPIRIRTNDKIARGIQATHAVTSFPMT
jgi:ankyrin repeat protein